MEIPPWRNPPRRTGSTSRRHGRRRVRDPAKRRRPDWARVSSSAFPLSGVRPRRPAGAKTAGC